MPEKVLSSQARRIWSRAEFASQSATVGLKIIPRYLFLAIVIDLLLFGIRDNGTQAEQIPTVILLYVAVSSLYLVAAWFSLQQTVFSHWELALILLCALGFRATIWPAWPSLSDDIYRYRWEGGLQAAGGDPYQTRPLDPAWRHLRDAAYPGVVLKDFKAAYGPLIEQEELWTYRLAARITPDPLRQVFWFKLPAALFDLGLIAALWALLAAHGLPPGRVLVYAWCPLPVIEFWGSGHNDGIPVLCVLLALVAARRERWPAAFALLGLGAAAKIWPALLILPFCARDRRWWMHVWAAPLAVLPWIPPYLGNVGENARFLSGFLGGWRNNDSLYGLLLWLWHGDLYRAKYAAFAVLACAVMAVTWMRLEPHRATLAVIVVTLLISANCHPWYPVWFLPLLALLPRPALFLWVALMPLAYAVLLGWRFHGAWDGSSEIRWLIWIPVYLLGIALWLGRFGLRWRKDAAAARRG